jgi:tetratricopeptide (TPR) repeat protein
LAFLLGSTPARNSDLWLHLASGRLLAGGQFPGGIDPFASTTAGVYWANHSWLTDGLMFWLYELDGGTGLMLVLAKSLLAASLAGLLFCFRRPGARLESSVWVTLIAVVSLGPWLTLQPALLSLLGVLLTLYLLERPSLLDGRTAGRARGRRWLLLPLFALWANVDAWFFLGPILVGLYALGEIFRGRRGEVSTLLLLTVAGFAACLLTPYHYHALAWPSRLGMTHAEQALMHDPLGRDLVVSPFGARFLKSAVAASPGGWAYYLLLAAGLMSFALAGRTLHPGRLLVWLSFAALSIYQARAIPFFAIMTATLATLNAMNQEPYVGKAARGRILDSLFAAARGLAVLAGIILVVLAWPGWLQPAPYQPRGWKVEPDPSMVRLARQLETWHAEHRFRGDRFALTFSPEVAHHLAWFCPGEKGFLDSRWPLFDRTADDFVRMRQCLLSPGGPGPAADLYPLLNAHQIDRILVEDPNWERTALVYRSLLQANEEWELLTLAGAAALFGRRSGEGNSRWEAFSLHRQAYHPDRDPTAGIYPATRAPLMGPPRPERPGFFDAFLRARDERSPDRAEAGFYLIYFDLRAQRMGVKVAKQWLLAVATGLAGAGAGMAPLGMLTVLPLTHGSFAEQMGATFAAARDRGPPEALWLAIRAARRALAANSGDGGAALLLGEAYLRLARQTREQSWRAALPLLEPIRMVQALTALEQAVSLRPDLDQAHALLAALYYDTGQLDRALDHVRARLQLSQEREADTAALRAQVETLEAMVRRAEDIYRANTHDKTDPSKVLERTRLAARHGLSKVALAMLLKSHPAIFGMGGTRLQLDLMLQAGRAYDVRAWLEPEHEAALGYGHYHRLLAEAAAACGDYAGADKELDHLSEEFRRVKVAADKLMPVRAALAIRTAGAVLERPILGAGAAGVASAAYFQFTAMRPAGELAALLRQEADFRVLRGLLALEAGAVETAAEHCRAALAVWGNDAMASRGAGLDFAGRRIAEYLLSLLE